MHTTCSSDERVVLSESEIQERLRQLEALERQLIGAAKDIHGETENQTPGGQFFAAAAEGNLNKLVEALKSGANINAVNYNKQSALHKAADGELQLAQLHVKMVNSLIKRGIDLTLVDHWGNTALHSAVNVKYYSSYNVAIVDALLQAGISVNAKNDEGKTALEIAITRGYYPDVVELLLKAGADSNAINKRDDMTPLMLAAGLYDKPALIKMLINYKADLEAKEDPLGRTALWYATFMERLENIEELLQSGADINTRDKYGATPLYWAAANGRTEVVKLLLKHGADFCKNINANWFETPLVAAARNGHTEIVELLLQAGAWRNPFYWTDAKVQVEQTGVKDLFLFTVFRTLFGTLFNVWDKGAPYIILVVVLCPIVKWMQWREQKIIRAAVTEPIPGPLLYHYVDRQKGLPGVQ
jgi:ankyrin repeat protein